MTIATERNSDDRTRYYRLLVNCRIMNGVMNVNGVEEGK